MRSVADETQRMTRHITIPLTIIAAALMVVYAVQMRLARKTDDTQASADERIARLQDDEE